MNKYILSLIICLISQLSNSQHRDTIYIKFDQEEKNMRKDDFTSGIQADSLNEKMNKSISYYIKQMENPSWSGNEFSFTHANHPERAYKIFGGAPPAILKKSKTYIDGKKILDINFFRTTPYRKVCKTFEEEDSWEQDVMIFMMDVAEMKNDSIILRQVYFTRPVKQ